MLYRVHLWHAEALGEFRFVQTNDIWEIFSYLLIFPDCDQKFWKNQRSLKWSHAPSLSPWNYFAYTMLLLASMARATIPFIALSMSKYSTSFLSTWLKGLLVLQEDIWTYTLFKVIKVKYYSLVQRIKTIISSKLAFLCQKWHMAVSVLNFLRDKLLLRGHWLFPFSQKQSENIYKSVCFPSYSMWHTHIKP